jgi:hypothetical protein
VLLTGLGDNAHVYDQFAYLRTDSASLTVDRQRIV